MWCLKGENPMQNNTVHLQGSVLDTESSNESSSSSYCSNISVIAPPFSSVVSDIGMTTSESDNEDLIDDGESDQPSQAVEAQSEQLQLEEVSKQPQSEAVDIHSQLEEIVCASEVYSYKLAGDNIDLTVKARYMQIDGQRDQSLHYFHHMCIHDRIDSNHKP